MNIHFIHRTHPIRIVLHLELVSLHDTSYRENIKLLKSAAHKNMDMKTTSQVNIPQYKKNRPSRVRNRKSFRAAKYNTVITAQPTKKIDNNRFTSGKNSSAEGQTAV